MLSGKVLNSTATLNDFDEIESLEFISGEEITLVIRLTQRQRTDELRYVPSLGATLTLTLPQTDGTTVDVAPSVFTDDRSIWSVVLTETDTATLAPGAIELTLVDGGTTLKGFISNSLSLTIIGC